MAKLCTMRDVSCTCRFAPLCPGFGGRGRAFSSSEKKPPAGLKEGSWKKSNRARALSMSHSRCAVERREARRPRRRKVFGCRFRHHAPRRTNEDESTGAALDWRGGSAA